MNVPVEQYCRICDGFLKMVYTSGVPAAPGQHDHLEDCVEELGDRIRKLELEQGNQADED